MAICPRCNGTGQIAGGGGPGGGSQGDPFDAQMQAQLGNNAVVPGMGRASPSLQANSMARAQAMGNVPPTGTLTGGFTPPPASQGPQGEPPPPGTLTGGYTPMAAPRPQQQGILSGLDNPRAQQQRRIM